jgi:hypothetical protein
MSALRTFLSHFLVAAVLCRSGFLVSSADADIIVAIENVTTAVTNPAGTAITADVLVSWNVDGESVDVDYASLQFLISRPLTATSSLAFRNPQHDSQLVDSTYLFHDNSLAFSNGITPGTVSSASNLNDAYMAFDTRNDKNLILRLGNATRLMFQLDLVATGVPTGNEIFRVELLIAGSSFADNNGVPIPFALKSGTQGVITLSGETAAVPEPGAGTVLLFGVGVAAWHHRRRKVTLSCERGRSVQRWTTSAFNCHRRSFSDSLSSNASCTRDHTVSAMN